MNYFAPTLQQQLKHDPPYAWFLRHQASASPIFRRRHLAELDERLEAYLDCFLISQKEGASLLPKLNLADWGAVFVMAIIALRTRDETAFKTAIDALDEEQQAKELSDALCWTDAPTAKPFIDRLLHHQKPLARVAAVTALGYFNTLITDEKIHQSLKDGSPEVTAVTLKLIGRNKLTAHRDSVAACLAHNHEAVRFQAACAGNLLRIPGALEALNDFCFNETPHLREALALLYQVLPETGIDSTTARIQNGLFSPRIKSYSIAMAGLPAGIPILLAWMQDPEYAPLAGEAFSFITGADIEEDDLSILDVELSESQEAPLSEKRKRDPWTESYEEDIPWPDPKLVENWWQLHRNRFQNGTRYLAGKTLTEENLRLVLNEGTQPQRHITSLILAVKDPKAILRTVRGRTTL